MLNVDKHPVGEVSWRCCGERKNEGPRAGYVATVTGADSPSLASEFVVIRKRFRPPYIVGKEGESRDSWRRRLPSCVL